MRRRANPNFGTTTVSNGGDAFPSFANNSTNLRSVCKQLGKDLAVNSSVRINTFFGLQLPNPLENPNDGLLCVGNVDLAVAELEALAGREGADDEDDAVLGAGEGVLAVNFAAGLAAELGDDRAGAPDEAAHDGGVAHEAERDLPREHLEDGALGSVGVGDGRALRRRRGLVVVAVIGVGSGGVLHCVA